VLIVDDSRILRSVVRKLVRLAGVEEERIHEANDGREGLAVIDAHWIDLVLLDINMPVMDGEQFTRALRQNPANSDVAVIVVSTEANNARLQSMRSLGVVDFLRKPFEPEELYRLIGKVIGVKS
jgi:two-component system chemotaxis response regulator CheY